MTARELRLLVFTCDGAGCGAQFTSGLDSKGPPGWITVPAERPRHYCERCQLDLPDLPPPECEHHWVYRVNEPGWSCTRCACLLL